MAQKLDFSMLAHPPRAKGGGLITWLVVSGTFIIVAILLAFELDLLVAILGVVAWLVFGGWSFTNLYWSFSADDKRAEIVKDFCTQNDFKYYYKINLDNQTQFSFVGSTRYSQWTNVVEGTYNNRLFSFGVVNIVSRGVMRRGFRYLGMIGVKTASISMDFEATKQLSYELLGRYASAESVGNNTYFVVDDGLNLSPIGYAKIFQFIERITAPIV